MADEVAKLREQLNEQEAENRRQRTTISELEEQVYQVEELEEKVADLTQRLEDAEKLTPDGAAKRIRALEDEVLAKSKAVVEQGEKNLTLQQELGRSKKEADALRADGAKLRATLVTHIAGPSANVDNFKNVSLDDMFRIYQKQASGDGGRGSTRGGRRVRSPGSRPTSRASKAGSTSGSQAGGSGDEAGDAGAGGGAGGSGSGGDEDMPEALHQVLAAEREVQTLRTHNRKMFDKVEALEAELAQARNVARNVHAAKAKVSDMARRARNEKQSRLRAENEVKRGMEKVEALMEHIEKLMVHLKHEAAAKAKAFEAQQRAERDIKLLKNRNAVLTKKNHARDRLINELKEGAKILEDQLRLMDEKYIELRNKLDWTRQHSQKEVRRIQAQATRLRAKVMMSRTAFDLGASDSGMSPGPSTAPAGQRRPRTNHSNGGNRSGVGNSQSTPQLRDVRAITMPLDPAADTDPTLPWSNTRLSKTYMAQQ